MRIRRSSGVANLSLLAVAAGSCVLLLHPLVRADPNPGDCTDQCQNKLEFYSYAGPGPFFRFE